MHRMALHGVLRTHPGAARHGDGCQDRTTDKSHNFVFHLVSPLVGNFFHLMGCLNVRSRSRLSLIVFPAQAGIQVLSRISWIPALADSAGMTADLYTELLRLVTCAPRSLHACARGDHSNRCRLPVERT